MSAASFSLIPWVPVMDQNVDASPTPQLYVDYDGIRRWGLWDVIRVR